MAKDIISAYRNVCRDLQGLEAYRDISHIRMKQAHKVVFKGKMPSSQMCFVPLDRAIEDYNAAADDFNETLQSIEQLSAVKERLELIISSMSEVEQIVILLHVEQGKNLREIAEMSNYSYDYLRRINSIVRSKVVTISSNAS